MTIICIKGSIDKYVQFNKTVMNFMSKSVGLKMRHSFTIIFYAYSNSNTKTRISNPQLSAFPPFMMRSMCFSMSSSRETAERKARFFFLFSTFDSTTVNINSHIMRAIESLQMFTSYECHFDFKRIKSIVIVMKSSLIFTS